MRRSATKPTNCLIEIDQRQVWANFTRDQGLNHLRIGADDCSAIPEFHYHMRHDELTSDL
jgi:hypothetical protein